MKTTLPNILVILSDEHRGHAMSHAGDPNLRTPEMDRLCSEGTGFRRAYANCPVCVPSRATILSGRHAHASPVCGFWDNYKVAAPSAASILREHGYHTAFFGKWDLGWVRDQKPPLVKEHPGRFRDCNARTPERHRAGFQDWFAYEAHNQHIDGYYYHQREINPRPLEGYISDNMADLFAAYVADRDPMEPLFAMVSLCPPHFPLVVPERWQRFVPGNLDVRPNFQDTAGNRENLALYYAMIENLDWNIGRLRASFEMASRSRDSIIVYVSDHGEFLGSHGIAIGKEHPHEESVRIPALFHAPDRIPSAGPRDGLFSLVDLLPTLLGLAELPVPDYCQGFDWSPLLSGDSGSGPSTVLLEMPGNPHTHMGLLDWRGFVDQSTKYALYEDGREILFDLEQDPFERANLASNDPRTAPCRSTLLALLEQSDEPFFHVLMNHPSRATPSRQDEIVL